jgi:hypothetical protein
MATPALRSAWLLRAAALVSVVAMALGVVVAPGLKGVASDLVVGRWDIGAATFAYAMGLLLVGLLATGLFDLVRAPRISPGVRGSMVFGASVVVALVIPAFVHTLAPLGSVVIIAGATTVALVGGLVAMRTPHTRAGGLLLVLMACSALTRLIAWRIAVGASESLSGYGVARGFATVSVVFEGLAQAATVVWVGMRGRWVGQLATPLALAGAFILVWGAGEGRGEEAAQWQFALHGALAWVPPPEPFGLGTLSVFFGVSAPLLGLATMIAVRKPAAVSSAMALALIGRGALDVPLRALATCAAATWMVLAMMDERAMWAALVAEKKAAPPPQSDEQEDGKKKEADVG